MNLLAYNALLYASDVIIPVGMDGMAILGARQTLAGIHEIRELWPERRLDLLAVLPTAVNVTTNATRAAFEALADDVEMRDRLYRRGIRQCIDVTYALAQRQTIWEYAPRSRAAEDYDAFVRVRQGRRGRRQPPSSERTRREGREEPDRRLMSRGPRSAGRTIVWVYRSDAPPTATSAASRATPSVEAGPAMAVRAAASRAPSDRTLRAVSARNGPTSARLDRNRGRYHGDAAHGVHHGHDRPRALDLRGASAPLNPSRLIPGVLVRFPPRLASPAFRPGAVVATREG